MERTVRPRRQELEDMASIDRLSRLPDDVICHILSFLPTKLSVSTSALAKRWRFMWAHVPNLEFYGDDFNGETKEADIVNGVVMLHEAKMLNTFSLSFVNCSGYKLETWITKAVQCGVRNLYLIFNNLDVETVVFTLPRRLLTCKTIVDLELDRCKGIRSSGQLFLPSLKKLHLRYCGYDDGESLPHLLSGCPVLEELIVELQPLMEESDLDCIQISSRTIKKLNVEFYDGSSYYDYMLIINAPALSYLRLNGCELHRCKGIPSSGDVFLPSLKKLHLGYCEYHDDESFPHLLSGCPVIEELFIKLRDDKLVDIVVSKVKFDNLTKLEIGSSVDWHYLVKFLEATTNLEVLIVDLNCYWDYRDIRVPTCLLSSLKTVKINNFRDSFEHHFAMVRYLLINAQVLKRMDIHSVYIVDSYKLKFDALRRISMFERGSKSCQLDFH